MAWIKTIPFTEADLELRKALDGQHALYPKEYARDPEDDGRRSLGPLARETQIIDGGTGEDVTLLGACALLLTRELGLTVHR